MISTASLQHHMNLCGYLDMPSVNENKSCEVGVHEDHVVLKIVGHHHVSAFVVRTTNLV